MDDTEAQARFLAAPPALGAVPEAEAIRLQLVVEGLPPALQGRRSAAVVAAVGVAAALLAAAGAGAASWPAEVSLAAAAAGVAGLVGGVGLLRREVRRSVVLGRHGIAFDGLRLAWADTRVEIIERSGFGRTWVFTAGDERVVFSVRTIDAESDRWLDDTVRWLAENGRGGSAPAALAALTGRRG